MGKVRKDGNVFVSRCSKVEQRTGEDERGVWAMTYGRGQVALAGPSAAELDLDVLRGEFKALKKREFE